MTTIWGKSTISECTIFMVLAKSDFMDWTLVLIVRSMSMLFIFCNNLMLYVLLFTFFTVSQVFWLLINHFYLCWMLIKWLSGQCLQNKDFNSVYVWSWQKSFLFFKKSTQKWLWWPFGLFHTASSWSTFTLVLKQYQ